MQNISTNQNQVILWNMKITSIYWPTLSKTNTYECTLYRMYEHPAINFTFWNEWMQFMFDLEHRWKVLEFGTVCASIRLWLGTHNGIQGKSCWKISSSAGPTNPRQHCSLIIHKYSWIGRRQCYPRDVSRKERENVVILKKTGGRGLPKSHFHIYCF